MAVRVGRRTQAPAARWCNCVHNETAHQHYRPGTDCALCRCDRFREYRRPGLVRRVITFLDRHEDASAGAMFVVGVVVVLVLVAALR